MTVAPINPKMKTPQSLISCAFFSFLSLSSLFSSESNSIISHSTIQVTNYSTNQTHLSFSLYKFLTAPKSKTLFFPLNSDCHLFILFQLLFNEFTRTGSVINIINPNQLYDVAPYHPI